MNRTLLVAVGGLVGSVARYWLAGWVQSVHGAEFPVGTLVVNVLGSFAIGALMTLSLERGMIGPEMRLLLTTGFCGGFTTMSTFSYETMALLRDGGTAGALGNIGLTLATCMLATWLGNVAGGMF